MVGAATVKLLRWLLVLPAAVAGWALILVPVALFVAGNCGERSNAMIVANVPGQVTIVAVIALVAMPFGFVYAGAWAAPDRRWETSVALALVVIAAYIGAHFIPGVAVGPWWTLPLNVIGAAYAIRATSLSMMNAMGESAR